MDTVLIPTSPELTESDIQLLSGYAKQLGKARSLPRKAVRSGQNLSKKKGHGIELQEVRPYVASDEVRHMDWRVTARTGKPHTKLYHQEQEYSVYFVVDYRSSEELAKFLRLNTAILKNSAMWLELWRNAINK